MSIWPVWVASKGRAHRAKVPAELNATIVVEPQDFCAYKAAFPSNKVVSLPKNNMGLAYVRNWIKNQNDSWYWMIDDDVLEYGVVTKGRCRKTNPCDVLIGVQQLACSIDGCVVAGMSYRQRAWSAQRPYEMFKSCDVVTAIHARKTRHIEYRLEYRVKVDREFFLQVCQAGGCMVRSNSHYFNTHNLCEYQGGLYDVYKSGQDKQACINLASMYPRSVRVVLRKDGRYDAQVDYRSAHPRFAKQV